MGDSDSITTSLEDESVFDEFDFKSLQLYWEHKGIPQSTFLSMGRIMWLASKVQKMMVDLNPSEVIGIFPHKLQAKDDTPTTFESSDVSSDVNSEVTSDDDYMMKSVSSIEVDVLEPEDLMRELDLAMICDTFESEFDNEECSVGSTIEVLSSEASNSSATQMTEVDSYEAVQQQAGRSHETIKPKRAFNSASVCVAVCVCLPLAVSCGMLINVLGKCLN